METKKLIRIPAKSAEFIKQMADFLCVSENDAIKMIIFDYMKNTNLELLQKGK